MATRLVVFKILFLVLIARPTLLLATHLDSDQSDRTRLDLKVEPQAVELMGVAGLGEGVKSNEYKELSEKPGSSKQPDPAELCYLSNGGSSLTLTVNEATQVGSIVGVVEVNGDPSQSGDIELSSSSNSNSAAANSSAINSNDPNSFLLSSTDQQTPSTGAKSSIQRRWAWWPQSSKQIGGRVEARDGQAPVELEPGSKNLILVRALDKESNELDQSLLVNVRCRAKIPSGSNLQSTTIPVRIIVTDANDNSPEFLGPQPYVLNISEATPIGSLITREIQAIDRDSAGPHSTLHYRVEEDGSQHAHSLHFPNPLEPALFLASQLDFETVQSFTLTIIAQDQGEPEPLMARAQVLVNVLDSDDQNPKFLEDKYTLLMDENQRNLVGQNLRLQPRNLRAQDGDKSIEAPIVYSFEEQPESSLSEFDHLDGDRSERPTGGDEQPNGRNIGNFLHLSKSSGEIRLLRQWPADWTFGPLTLVVRATQADNRDRYALTTLTISSTRTASTSRQSSVSTSGGDQRRGSGSLEFEAKRVTFEVSESTNVNEKIGTVRAQMTAGSEEPDMLLLSSSLSSNTKRRSKTDRRSTTGQQYSISYQILDDQTDQFGVNQSGEIILKRSLDFESRQVFEFRILASISRFSDVCLVEIRVKNMNDNKPKFTQPQYTFHLSEPRLRHSNIIGTVQAHDSDLNDTLSYSLSGEYSHLFQLDPSTGNLSLRFNSLVIPPNLTSLQLLVHASDSLGPKWSHHNATARLHLLISAQLVGRSLNEIQVADRSGHKSFESKSEQTDRVQHRSSLATVMSSLQHMVKSASQLEVPLPSALHLSALLALLICLLFMLVVAMSVHFYRRHSKIRLHRRQLIAATLATQAPNFRPQPPNAQFKPPLSQNRVLVGSNQLAIHPTFGQPKHNRSPSTLLSSGSSAPVSLLSGLRAARVAPSSEESSSPLNGHNWSTNRLKYKAKRSGDSPNSSGKSPGSHRNLNNGDNSLILSSVCSSKESYEKREQPENGSKSLNQFSKTNDSTDDDSSVIKCGHYSLRQDPRAATFSCCDLANENPTNILSIKTIESQGGTQMETRGWPSESHIDPCEPNVTSYKKFNALNSPANEAFEQSAPNSQSLIALIKDQNRIRWPENAMPQRVKRLTWDDEHSLSYTSNRATPSDQLEESSLVAPQIGDYASRIMNSASMVTDGINQAYRGGNSNHAFLFSAPNSPSQMSSNWQASKSLNMDGVGIYSGELEAPSLFCSGQDNCFDYTIVESSQFHVDSLAKLCRPRNQLDSQLNGTSSSTFHHQTPIASMIADS